MNELQSCHYRNVTTDPLGSVAVPLRRFRSAHSGNHWPIAKTVNLTNGLLTLLTYHFTTHIYAAFLVDDISYKLLGPICMASDVIQNIRHSTLSLCQRKKSWRLKLSL